MTQSRFTYGGEGDRIAEVSDNTKHKGNGQPHILTGCLLLGIAALPDAMVVPVLHDLTVERFGVSEGVAHLFMAINLLGALLAIGVLALLNRRFSSSTLFITAAFISAILMACMANTTSWNWMLAYRCIEGGADLLLLAIPFRLIAGAGVRASYAKRIGVGFTVMMTSLALGAGLGGQIGQEYAHLVLWAGAASMGVLTLIAAIMRRNIDNLPASPRPAPHHCPLVPREWLGAGFLAIDRLLAALVATSLPILLASGFEITPMTLGIALAGMFLSLAVFSAPAGILADHYGGGKIRMVAALMCGFALTGLGLMVWLPPVVVLPPCLLLYGVGAAGLMPSAFCAAVRPEASNLVFSSLQAAGQAGYAAGVLGGSFVVTVFAIPPDLMLSRLFPIAGVSFIILNAMLLLALKLMEKRLRTAIT